MNSIADREPDFNHVVLETLSTLDIIEHEIDHCQGQAAELAQLAEWYRARAADLVVERVTLAANVGDVLRQAEELLR